jgi:ribosomal protein L37AE/L43A
MVKVNEAWEVLSNSELRKQYDQMLEKGAGVNDQFAEALERAKNYPKSWAKFDQWFNAIGRDFTDANYGSAEFAGISVPTSGNSLTGWLFIFAGGLLGLALAAFLYLTLMPELQPVRSPFGDGTFQPRQSRKHNPILARVLFIGLGAAGAWLGRLFHGGTGSIIRLWFSKIVSGVSTALSRESTTDSPAGGVPKSELSEKAARLHTQCPKCQQKLKLPAVERAGVFTCPKCRHQFENSNSPTPSKSTSMQLPPNKITIARIFRGLLIAEIAIVAFQLPVFFIENSIIVERGLIIEEEAPNIFLAGILFLLFVILVAVLITSWIGLFKYRNWARWLYAGALLFGSIVFVPYSCFDISVHWGLSTSVSEIGSYITGSILAIIFLSPLAAEFQTVANTASHE